MGVLEGKQILVTRELEQAKTMTSKIQQLGGISIEIPLLSFKSADKETFRRSITHLEQADWVFFTSANGVAFFFDQLEEEQLKLPSHLSIAVVGLKTEQALQQYGYHPSFVPSRYSAYTLGTEFIEQVSEPLSIVLIQGNLSRTTLKDTLSRGPYEIQTVIMYETVFNVTMETKLTEAIANKQIDALTFTSPSAVRAFTRLAGHFEEVFTYPCACIGPTTEQEARKLGFTRIVVPKTYTVEAMIEQLALDRDERNW
ncbi:uroporphyrinogen-III synthase [Pontibacillus halophilus JSM 076056 = DSM 19796]|uniref:Uroporphyrinogen-III synthase n=1 Tax=Pontibacillus halophilus JSM 076056 = DSM 19796 TaxID=1385510 RepID=A0A0A5GQM7_9BACI|nr:uroporphyrinogen-III synthase [Pontibacillus halophilus]KGX93465.1 uroporphyrinogen-III synthase [Pontibacillus halophilus JSM 076056 = DSM 19796]